MEYFKHDELLTALSFQHKYQVYAPDTHLPTHAHGIRIRWWYGRRNPNPDAEGKHIRMKTNETDNKVGLHLGSFQFFLYISPQAWKSITCLKWKKYSYVYIDLSLSG